MPSVAGKASPQGIPAATYPEIKAIDAVDGNVQLVCTPSGGPFPIGTIPVTCTATDDAGNVRSASFRAIVRATTAPQWSNLPDGMAIDVEAESKDRAVARFAPTATDEVDSNSEVTCRRSSGSVFPIGTTPVTCTATDDAGNVSTATFTIEVRDTTPPVLTNVAADLTLEATSSAW